MNVATVPLTWWHDHINLAHLYAWLDDRCEAPDIVEFLEKPWHWEPEWEDMLRERTRT